MRPLVVVEGSERSLLRIAARLRRDGWVLRSGLSAPAADLPQPRDLVWIGTVDDQKSSRQALMLALAGDGLLIRAEAARPVIDSLVEDLRHVGSVAIVDNDDAVSAAYVLPPQHQRLVGLLLDGRSLVEAAAMLSLSLRTADRRMAQIRQFFGAGSTAEAIRLARDRLR